MNPDLILGRIFNSTWSQNSRLSPLYLISMLTDAQFTLLRQAARAMEDLGAKGVRRRLEQRLDRVSSAVAEAYVEKMRAKAREAILLAYYLRMGVSKKILTLKRLEATFTPFFPSLNVHDYGSVASAVEEILDRCKKSGFVVENSLLLPNVADWKYEQALRRGMRLRQQAGNRSKKRRVKLRSDSTPKRHSDRHRQQRQLPEKHYR